MKAPFSHFLTALAAAGLGWLAGALFLNPNSAARDRIAAGAEGGGADGPGGKTGATPPGELARRMSAELAVVRAVPGASSETAWVQWAMGVADADIPGTVARLNPLTDLHALRYLYARWTRLDPKAAWDSFCKSKIPRESKHFYNSVSDYGEGSQLNRGSMWDQPRSLIAGRMLRCWKEVDPAGAEAMFAKLKDPHSPESEAAGASGYQLEAVMDDHSSGAALSKERCLAKAAEAEALPQGDKRREALQSLMQQWMVADARSAGEWLKNLPDTDRSSLSFGGVLPYLAALPFGERGDYLLSSFEKLPPVPVSETFDPVNIGRPDYFSYEVSGQAQATESFLKDWAAQDPAAMSGWLKALPEGPAKENLTARAAVALVGHDERSAITLLNSMEGNQQEALKTFMSGWTASDAAASLEWAGKIPDVATRDDCLATATASLAGSDPDLALKNAQSISNPTLRQAIFNRVENNLNWNPAALAKLREQYPDGAWRQPATP